MEQTLDLSSRPEEMIYYPYLTSNQSAPSTPLNPHCLVILSHIICNLHAIREFGLSSISFPFSGGTIHNKIANISPLQFLESSVWLCQRPGDELFLFSHTGRTEAEEMEPKECPASFLFPSSKDIMATDIPKSVEKGTMVGRVSPEGQEAQESRYHQGCVNQRLTGGRGRRKFERISRGRGRGTILSGPSF